MRPSYRHATLFTLLLSVSSVLAAEPIDQKYPLGDDLRVLEIDTQSADYHKLVEAMIVPDLNAEWPRVETRDNPERFARQHGGLDKVLADPELKSAYERRVKIRERYLELMRAAYAKRKQTPPFDKGIQAEAGGTTARQEIAADQPLAYVLPSPGADQHWPRFRGPTGQGNVLAADKYTWPIEWDTTKNVVWKSELPGDGNSSPVIWGDKLFLTSASDSEGEGRAIHCLDRNDGQLLWTYKVPEHKIEPMVRDKNGFASSTPVVDGERVIAYFGAGGLVCVNFDGQPIWHHPTPGFDSTWGSAASPLLYNDLVILIHDQNKATSLCLALDKRTGEVRWNRERKKAMGWATPVVARVGERDELLYAGSETLQGYDPQTGEELWSLAGPTIEVVPTVVIGPQLIFSASGRQGPTLGVRPGGSGDVTDSHLVWRAVRGGPHVPSPVLYQDRLYVINDFGIASCLEAKTGEFVWQERVRDKFSASGVEVIGLLYFASETGKIYVIRPGDKLDLVATNDLKEPILASPAALAGKLYFRAGRTLYCIADQ